MLADLVVDLLVAQIGLNPDPGGLELRGHLGGIAIGIGHDRRDHRLNRREPDRETSGVMFDQDADEPLERAQNGAVQHHWAVLLSVFPDV